MIGSYMHSLYDNCKALEKTSAYNFESVRAGFLSAVSEFVNLSGFRNEQELIRHLTTQKYSDTAQLLERSAFIKIFYLVNSFGEYHSRDDVDELGRFRFEASVQHAAGITDNIVLQTIHGSLANHSFLKTGYKISNHTSYFYLSHDIDSLYGSTLQDGLWALKRGKFDVLLKIFANIVLAKPHWFNIDKIMQLESEYNFRSTFYWLVNKGKIDARQTNSDYTVNSKAIKETLREVRARGFENGLHKSISDDSFASELSKFPEVIVGNRYHYLKYALPAAYNELELSGIKLDASLGFAEHYGFRNNYGYPFSPFNSETSSPYSFLEVPLNVMDGTFQRYMKVPVEKTATTVIDFFEKNKENCLISVLWHNTFFTDYKYKGYREEYVKILQYLYEAKFRNINQSEIIKLFSWSK
jgi:hypothetical protein